jgi:hypothetical protein
MGYEYRIVVMPGEDNVWADLLSRWGVSNATVCAMRVMYPPKSPELDAGFEWSSVEELAKLQEKYGVRTQGERSAGGLALTKRDQLMVPKEATDFQLRICIVAHSGATGHREIAEGQATVMKVFWYDPRRGIFCSGLPALPSNRWRAGGT